MDAVRNDVEYLVAKELESANKQFPPFCSHHEGYAVIKEELEEAEECTDSCKQRLTHIWLNTKHNRSNSDLIKNLKKEAIDCAVEMIQVAAMAQKYLDSLEVDA